MVWFMRKYKDEISRELNAQAYRVRHEQVRVNKLQSLIAAEDETFIMTISFDGVPDDELEEPDA